jgi:hypothetical protein
MKDIDEVLRQKERELRIIEREVEALRIAAPLLSDGNEASTKMPPQSERAVGIKDGTTADVAPKRWP